MDTLHSSSPSRLMVLMFTDVVGSAQLKTRFGTPVYASIIARHDQLFRNAITQAGGAGAEILQDTGDGHYASFPTSSAAVRCALRFQHDLSIEPWPNEPLKVRIGIHLGEMAEVRPGDGVGTAPKLAGLAVDLAARVMSLAVGRQILLTRFPFNDARQFIAQHPPVGGTLPALKWIAHGPYLLKGIDEPVEVFEVGAEGIAPLSVPPNSEKARRVVPHDLEETLGWRPAMGLEIPGRTGWTLQHKLGEGGFGEVWLGQRTRLHDQRVFKFCFDPERLRSFKREMTFFRLLRDALGDRPDIARLHEVKLDESPYFLESDYTDGGNLTDWAQSKGGIDKIPLAARLDLVARVADAIAAAHSVGILHKDVKPSNILIYRDQATGEHRPRLSDFGIGMLTDRGQLVSHNITETGFTLITENDSSRTGTRMYAPPELMAGKPFTVQGDVYALGILLYQTVVGDLSKPLGEGWEREVSDPLLREDITAAVDGDPTRRLATPQELGTRIRTLSQRHAKRREMEDAVARAARRQRLTRVLAMSVVFLVLAGTIAGLWTAKHIGNMNEAAQRHLAETRLADLRELTNDFMFKWDNELVKITGSTPARKMLASTAMQSLDRVSMDPSAGGPLRRELAVSYVKVGDILRGRFVANVGDTAGAQICYDKALQIRLDLAANNPSDGGMQRDLADSYERKGDIQAVTGQTALSMASYARALEISRCLAQTDPANREFERNLSSAYQRMGSSQSNAGHTADALVSYQKSLDICLRVAGDNPRDATAQSELGICCYNIGDLQSSAGKSLDALASYRHSLDIGLALVQADPTNSLDQRELLATYSKIGRLQAAIGHTADAISSCDKCLEISRKLARQDPGNVQAQRDLMVCCQVTGNIQAVTGRTDDALATYRMGLQISLIMTQADPANMLALEDLCTNYDKVGDILEVQGHTVDELDNFGKSLKIRQSLAGGDPQNIGAQRVLSVSYDKLGNAQTIAGHYADALANHNMALNISQKLSLVDPDNTEAQRDLSVDYEDIGDTYAAADNSADALASYQKDLEISLKLARADAANTRLQRDLSVSYTKVGDYQLLHRMIADAQTNYSRALEISLTLSRNDPADLQALRDLSSEYDRLSQTQLSTGQFTDALANCNKGLEMSQKLSLADPANAQDQMGLAVSHFHLAAARLQIADQKDLTTAERLGHLRVAVTEFGLAKDIASRLKSNGLLPASDAMMPYQMYIQLHLANVRVAALAATTQQVEHGTK